MDPVGSCLSCIVLFILITVLGVVYYVAKDIIKGKRKV